MQNKFPFLIILFICLTFNFKIYSQFTIEGHAIAAIPIGQLSKYSNPGAGAGLRLQYLFNEKTMAMGLSGDYFSLSTKSEFTSKAGGIYYSCIPITLHYLYLFRLQKDFITPYFGINVGAYNESMTAGSLKFGPNAFKDFKKLSFGFAPEAGLRLRIVDHVNLNLAVKISKIVNGIIPKYIGITYPTKPEIITVKQQTAFISFNAGISYIFP